MRAFLYARVSTDRKLDSDQRRQEVENQLPIMRELVTSSAWTIRREYIDRVTGTGKKQRTQFDEMMAACDRREVDIIVIWALDRFSREGPLKTMLLMDRLVRCGVRVKSIKETWLDPDSPTYDLLLPIFAWIAQQESRRLGERVKAGMARVKEQGAQFGRPRVSADLAQIGTYRAHGWSYRRIAAKLGVSEGTVRNLLKGAGTMRNKGIEISP